MPAAGRGSFFSVVGAEDEFSVLCGQRSIQADYVFVKDADFARATELLKRVFEII